MQFSGHLQSPFLAPGKFNEIPMRPFDKQFFKPPSSPKTPRKELLFQGIRHIIWFFLGAFGGLGV